MAKIPIETEEDLLYRPKGDLLRKLYPDISADEAESIGLHKQTLMERMKKPNITVYCTIKNLNKSKPGEDTKSKRAIEVGIKGTF